eukprot:scaffold90512_cov72-Phaeocystis_antarctica.AAC.8
MSSASAMREGASLLRRGGPLSLEWLVPPRACASRAAASWTISVASAAAAAETGGARRRFDGLTAMAPAASATAKRSLVLSHAPHRPCSPLRSARDSACSSTSMPSSGASQLDIEGIARSALRARGVR